MKIKIVYFAYLLTDHWKPIVQEQLESLKNIDLYEECESILMSIVVENGEDLIELQDMLDKNFQKIKLDNIFYTNVFEYPGFKTICETATNENDCVFLYFHTKGMTSNSDFIRNFLFKNTIENYKNYISEFEKNKDLDVAGVFTHAEGLVYYNFFWCRSSYVFNYWECPTVQDNRFIWELWIGNKYSRKKNIVTFSPIYGYDKIIDSSQINFNQVSTY